MKISIDREFSNREELDSFIRSRFGENQEENIKHEIEVTSEEAQKLSLDNSTKVFGVRTVIIE